MFERRGNFLQHAAIDLDLAAGDFETDTLAQFFGSLPDDPVQTVGQTAGLHHAYRQQFLMEHVVDARLGEQRGIGVVEVAQQVLLDGGDVVDRLGHHPRDFLELGETVEFERVEFGMLRFGQHMA